MIECLPLPVGKAVSVQDFKGELRLNPASDFPERLWAAPCSYPQQIGLSSPMVSFTCSIWWA